MYVADIYILHNIIYVTIVSIKMITWHGNVFQVTGPWWGEPPITVVFPSQRASNAEFWCFLWCTNGLTNSGVASDSRYYHNAYMTWLWWNQHGCGNDHDDARRRHDDVIKWKHFPHYWSSFVRGIHRSPVDSPHKGQWRKSLMFSLICAWTNG